MRGRGAGHRAQGTGKARYLLAWTGALALLTAAGAAGQTRVLDDFAAVTGWTAAPSGGVRLALSADTSGGQRAMRLDFDFQGHGGWAAARKAFALELPGNYELSFRIRAEAPVENLDFKLVDPSGENVWWSVRRDLPFPREWQTIRIKKRQISFAWGPAGGGEPGRVGAIEIAITAGSGGKGSVWIAELAFTELPPPHPYALTPVATASSSLPGRSPAQALTSRGGGWHSDANATGPQWLAIDFGERRELGGLVIGWEGTAAPRRYEVQTSEDGGSWTTAYTAPHVPGGRSYAPLPETDTRFLRIVLDGVPPDGAGIRELEVRAPQFAATPNDFIASVAKEARRGIYPRSFLGEMSSWTIVGVAGSSRPAALLGADSAFESVPRTFSIEPFVSLDGTLVTWADVPTEESLLDGDLPIPTVRWTHPSFTLDTTAFATGTPGDPVEIVRYRLANRSPGRITLRLLLAIRPFQVNPPSQFLNTPGGVGRVECIARNGGAVVVDAHRVVPLTAPWSFGAVPFDAGDIAVALARGEIPGADTTCDAGGRGSAVIAHDLDIPPGGAREVWLEVGPAMAAPLVPTSDSARWASEQLGLVATSWRERLDRVDIRLPGGDEVFVRAMKSNLAYILISADGPALRPGTRSYARSWIRDGTMMAAALLRLGHPEAVRDYLRWYAPFQYNGGKVPCCVDARGADPVPENDSNGEFLFLAAEYLRFTGDKGTVAGVWPQLASAVTYLDTLRQRRRTGAFRTPEKLALFGLLPESISHEGYSAKPMHSYWDDFWALAGLTDAVWLARTLGHPEEAARWVATREEFYKDLLTSIARVREARRLAYIPGCAELGDFDATSTTVALWPAGADADLPRAALDATFDRYWNEAERRFSGKTDWEAYTPYEWRSVGAFVRLGWRDRANQLARWLMADRTPIGWNQWPEVVHHDRRKAMFLGDVPHAWVGSDFIRSFLDMLAYDRQRDGALVLGAGVPAGWLAGDGVRVRRLRTPHGLLSFTMQSEAGTVHVRVEAGLQVPSGGIVLRPPLPPGPHVATVDGAQVAVSSTGEVIVRWLPADVVIRPKGVPTMESSGRSHKERG